VVDSSEHDNDSFALYKPGNFFASLAINSFSGMIEISYQLTVIKNFPKFYGTRRFITVFTRALHRSLS
jgi:hypothetical protein